MMQEVKKYQINIFDEYYTILSDESEKEIMEAANLIDSLMKEAAGKAQSVDAKRIAVLVALKVANKMKDIESKYNKMKEKEDFLIKTIDNELHNLKSS